MGKLHQKITNKTIMKVEKATLNFGEAPKVDEKAVYLIDFSKLESVNDLVIILGAMGISFSPTHPHWELVSKFANLDNPIYPNQGIPLPKKEEMKLPKLKSINDK